VRFLGRKVYIGVVVVLVSAMMHGVNRKRANELSKELEINEKTLRRWREWWLKEFVLTKFWKAARGRFMPLVDEETLPFSLVERFVADTRERVVNLLEFLVPLTTTWGEAVVAF